MDNRFSVADSEWSVDSSGINERYDSYPITEQECSTRMYDVPCTNQGHILNIEEEIEVIRSEEKSINGEKIEIKDSHRNFKGQKWMKVYIGVLTVFILALTGFLVHLAIRDSNANQENESSKDITISGRSSQNQELKLSNLQNELDDIKIKLEVILDVLQSKSIEETNIANLTTQPNGCKNDHVNVDGICYAPVTFVEPITQPEASINCWSKLFQGKLAMFTIEIQNAILSKLKVNTPYWGDPGSDRGTCSVLKRTTNSYGWEQCSCYDKYSGIICQYEAASL